MKRTKGQHNQKYGLGQHVCRCLANELYHSDTKLGIAELQLNPPVVSHGSVVVESSMFKLRFFFSMHDCQCRLTYRWAVAVFDAADPDQWADLLRGLKELAEFKVVHGWPEQAWFVGHPIFRRYVLAGRKWP